MKSGKLQLWAVLVFVVLACSVTIAENGDSEPQNSERENKEVLTVLEQQMLKEISIDFSNTPIEDVIRVMAAQADVDIIKSPKVVGNVTATLTNVPLEEALANILAAHGYGYVADKNMIRISPMDEISEKSERLVSKIYRITYADVKEVEKSLKKFVSNRGSLSANPGTSNIIVTDTESQIKAITNFIDEIDRITPQILVEARVYDVTSRDKLDLGIEWVTGRNTTYATGAIGTNPTAGHREPFVTTGFSAATGETADATVGFMRFGLLNNTIDIDVQLTAEQEDIDAKLLANPRILVLDNETALFDIVTEHPYVERTISGSTIQETVQFKQVGVRLEVTPHVTRDGMLRLHIIPEFGVVVGQVQIESSDVPIVDTRKVDTKALVKDGQTVVLGGMRKKDTSRQVNKVPLLGDLPLLGVLFRFEGEDTAVTELIVFITPRIIKHAVMSESEERAYEATEFSEPRPSSTRAEKEDE
jgi:type IV pilus assembly protein PilQ